ncbi:hypothetical protein ACFFHT_10125 [Gallibacterium melopsittaci]|uniref:Uncharacterized protein n=1 Tax=Gallibacterium melopsittaci TaxID=516063 RepID=A0ABV6HZ47_9PAST
MNILNNAILSIQLGIEDFEQIPDNPKRVYSSMRNLFAGMLLLFKHKLVLLSPMGSNEILIKERILPTLNNDGEIIWLGNGKKTVDVRSIKERFKNLNISVNWNEFDKANEIRNNIEHYFEETNIDSIRTIISKLFPIMRDFIIEHLKENPQKLIGDTYWEFLMTEVQIYIDHKQTCQKSLESLTFFNNTVANIIINKANCPKCGSECILPISLNSNADTVNYICQSCKGEFTYEEIAILAIENHYSVERHFAIKDGEDDPLTYCPECGEETYIYEEEMCASCGHEANHICPLCENTTDILNEMCSYCQYKLDNY